MKTIGWVWVSGALAALVACAPVEVLQPTSVVELAGKPAEQLLLGGIRAYDDGDYAAADTALRKALAEGLAFTRDVAVAWKYLAFIHCASNRPGECEAAFREAFAADAKFELTPKERGHPLWGPVFQRVKDTPRTPAPPAKAK